jgi:hypothetical protein
MDEQGFRRFLKKSGKKVRVVEGLISRVRAAVKSVRARLYYDAGLDTPDKFTQWEPEALRQMLVEFVERTGFEGIAPLPKELRNAITKARQLPEAVQY